MFKKKVTNGEFINELAKFKLKHMNLYLLSVVDAEITDKDVDVARSYISIAIKEDEFSKRFPRTHSYLMYEYMLKKRATLDYADYLNVIPEMKGHGRDRLPTLVYRRPYILLYSNYYCFHVSKGLLARYFDTIKLMEKRIKNW